MNRLNELDPSIYFIVSIYSSKWWMRGIPYSDLAMNILDAGQDVGTATSVW